MSELPKNEFKRAIAAGKQQIGLWISMANPYSAEICAGAGFDWMVLDGEHSPNDPTTILPQLQAAAPYPTTCIVRPAWNDTVLIKRYLDVGAQSLLIPYVQTAEEAAKAVAAIRKHVADAVLHMAELPLSANVQFMTIMATKMPFVGRG